MPIFRFCRLALAAALAIAVSAPALPAQDMTLQAMVAALLPDDRDRGIGRPAGGADASQPMAAGIGRPTAQLVVQFEGDSPRLTVGGMRTLRTLARALEDPRLTGVRLEIVGHAFLPAAPLSSGPVSARRAQAVAEHLSGFYGISAARLTTRGVGAVQVNPAAPNDPLNQRIEIVNLGAI